MAATTLTERAVVRLSGEDVRGFLQGLVTSDVVGDQPLQKGVNVIAGQADDCAVREGGSGHAPQLRSRRGFANADNPPP